mgnify:CR=1 FL=1
MNEISWQDRLDLYNHAPHFPTRVTCIGDTFPVKISVPEDMEKRKMTYNGKYKSCVVKVRFHKQLNYHVLKN